MRVISRRRSILTGTLLAIAASVQYFLRIGDVPFHPSCDEMSFGLNHDSLAASCRRRPWVSPTSTQRTWRRS